MYLKIHLEDQVEGNIIEERQTIMALQIYRLQISSSTTELRGPDEAATSEFSVISLGLRFAPRRISLPVHSGKLQNIS